MGNEKIKNLPQLLKNYLGPNKTITDAKISRLTAPGENFGSIMLKLDITLLNIENGTEEVLHAVAKTLPETEMFREIFNVQLTYSIEMAFYEIVVPIVQEFQRRLGITQVFNSVSECIATRKNLGNSDKIDDNAIIVLENLREQGFKNIDKIEGFDFETTKLILKDIAQFHAVFIALKSKEPEIFDKKVKPYCHDFKVNTNENELYENVLSAVLKEKEMGHFISKINIWGAIPRSAPREPFATIIHCDLWVNNNMQKFENGKAVANKLVDFQCFNYGSPAADMFFFLWTSVSQAVLKTNLDYFIKFYYENVLRELEKHKYDSNHLSFERFLKEIELECDYEIGHALVFMLITLSGITEICNAEQMVSNMVPKTKERICYMVSECSNRGWLN